MLGRGKRKKRREQVRKEIDKNKDDLVEEK